MREIRGMCFEKILTKCKKVEQNENINTNHSNEFYFTGTNTFIKSDFIYNTIFNPKYAYKIYGISFLGLKKFTKQLLNFLLNFTKEKYTLNLNCDIVKVQNNIRLFYYFASNTYTIKIYQDQKDLENAIKIRNSISSANLNLKPPSIYGFNIDKEPYYINEELIFGHSLSRKENELTYKNVINEIWELYRFNGISYESIRYFLEKSPELIYENFKKGMELAERNTNNNLENSKFIENIIFSEKELPYSICHGDLAPGEIINNGEEVYFCDWEKSRYLPIAVDLRKLYFRIPEMQKLILNSFGKFINSQNTLNSQKQFILTLIKRISNYTYLREYFNNTNRPEKFKRKLNDYAKYIDDEISKYKAFAK